MKLPVFEGALQEVAQLPQLRDTFERSVSLEWPGLEIQMPILELLYLHPGKTGRHVQDDKVQLVLDTLWVKRTTRSVSTVISKSKMDQTRINCMSGMKSIDCIGVQQKL
eukprot:9170232-Karenia_brevis.AAC.1